MIQAAMYFVLGLLTAGLIVLVIMPAVWRRAARLTRARVESSLPMTLAEIEADKDQLRANFAVANRKLELEAETLRVKLNEDTITRGRIHDEISALTRARAALGETVASLEERVAELSGALATAQNKLATAAAEIAARDRAMSDLDNRIADLKAELAAALVLTEEQRVEMVARNTEVANAGDRLSTANAEMNAAVSARDKAISELAFERDRLYAEQKRADGLAAGLAALEAERMSRLAELERAANDRQALDSGLAAERQRTLALARELEASRLGDGTGVAAAEGDNLRKSLAAAEAEKNDLARRLALADEAHTALRTENEALRHAAAVEAEGERAENRRLRERLGDIAANVMRISQAMDSNAPVSADRASRAAAPHPEKEPEKAAVADQPLAVEVTGTRH